MRTTVFLLFIIALGVVACGKNKEAGSKKEKAGGKKEKAGGKKEQDACKRPSSSFRRKCLKGGYVPTDLSEAMLEGCTIKAKTMAKRTAKKCAQLEKDVSSCPPVCLNIPDVTEPYSTEPPKVTKPAKEVTLPPKVVTEPPKVVTEPPKEVTEPPKVVTEPPKVVTAAPTEPPKICTKPTVNSCTYPNKVLGGAQLSPGYYNTLANFQACVTKCKGLALCRAIVFMPKINRCYVKSGAYLAAAPDTLGRNPSSLEMSCLEAECMEDFVPKA